MHCLRLIFNLHIICLKKSFSLEFYLLCHLLKSAAYQVVITVMEVFREEHSVRRVRARSRQNTNIQQSVTGSQQYHAVNLQLVIIRVLL